MATVHQTFTGDAKGVLKELEKMQKANTALEEKLNKVALAAAGANKKSREQAGGISQLANKAVTGITQWATSYLSLGFAIQAVNQALAEQRRLSEEAIKTQSNVAGGQAEVLKNLGDVTDAQGKQFLARLDMLRAETGMGSVVPIQMAASNILSATGGNQEQTLDILKAATPLFKTKPDDLAAFGGALADVQKALSAEGTTVDAKSTAALMLAIQGQARFTDLGSFKNVAPALAAADISVGDPLTETNDQKMRDVREGAALFAGIGSRLGDVSGERTKTAVSNLVANLKKAAPGEATIFERLEKVRQSPKLQAEVLKSGFEAAQKGAIEELVKGTGGKTGQLVDQAFTKIVGSEAALQRKTQQLEGLTPELAVRSLREKAAGNIEDAERSTARGRAGLAEEILFGKDGKPGTLAQTRNLIRGIGQFGDTSARLQFEARKMFGYSDEEAGIAELEFNRQQIVNLDRLYRMDGLGTGQLTPESQAKVDLIDKQTAVLKESLERIAGKTETAGRRQQQANAGRTVGKNSERN